MHICHWLMSVIYNQKLAYLSLTEYIFLAKSIFFIGQMHICHWLRTLIHKQKPALLRPALGHPICIGTKKSAKNAKCKIFESCRGFLVGGYSTVAMVDDSHLWTKIITVHLRDVFVFKKSPLDGATGWHVLTICFGLGGSLQSLYAENQPNVGYYWTCYMCLVSRHI